MRLPRYARNDKNFPEKSGLPQVWGLNHGRHSFSLNTMVSFAADCDIHCGSSGGTEYIGSEVKK
jgi:hypothetical protein